MSKNQRPLEGAAVWNLKNLFSYLPNSENYSVDYDAVLLHSTPFLDMGLTGFEPVTLRLSSACSNQLSYRPGSLTLEPTAQTHLGGGMGIRTPDL